MNLTKVVGLSIHDDKFQQFLKKTVKDSIPEVKKFKDVECHSYKKEGIAFDFKDEKIDSIFVYNDNSYGYKKYQGDLPDNLTFEMTNSQIVKKYGEPTGKGGFNIPVWISYDSKGIQIDFVNSSYEDNQNPIAFYTFY
eukprot:gene9654-1858_t